MKFGRPARRRAGPVSVGRAAGRGARPRGGDARPIRASRRRLPAVLRRWRLSPPRAAALLGILVATGGIYGLVTTPVFTLVRTELPALQWTTNDALSAAVATPDGSNLFQIRAGAIEQRLAQLPGVASATVTVSLPDTLVVRVREREAILAWNVGDNRFLVDRAGVIFGSLGTGAATDPKLPAIVDTRPGSTSLGIGSVLDPVDLDAATRLASLVPSDVGSVAGALVVSVTDANGFVVATLPPSWLAIFGLYTPNLRTPALIPAQVRLLRSLLAGREGRLDRVILADADSGTFILKATPKP